MNIRAIREALSEGLAGQGFRVYDTLPAKGQLPLAAVSWPDEIRYHTTLDGGVELDVGVTVAVSLTDFAQAQRDIDAVMSTPGPINALEAHQTAAWHQATVTTASNVRQVDVGAEALAVDLNLTLIA